MSSKLVSLAEILLKNDDEQRKETYTKLKSIIEDTQNESELSEALPIIATSLERDMVHGDTDIQTVALQFFCDILKISARLPGLNKESIYKIAPLTLYTTAAPDVIKVIFPNITGLVPFQKLLQAIHDALFKESKMKILNLVKEEAIKFLLNILSDKEKRKTDIESAFVKILQVLLALSADDSQSVRKNAVKTAHSFISIYFVKSSHIAPIASCLKVSIMPKIQSVYLKNATVLCEVLTHQWPLFLKIMGVNIRKSSSLINALLSIAEQGFRHSQADVKIASFKAWDCLIECLAEDAEVLSSARYMKLLMQPLTSMQSTDALNITRIETLWGLARKLGPKLPMLFTTVCLPIIHCCLGNLDPERQSKNSLDTAAASSIKARRTSTHGDGFYAALQASGYRATPKKASHSPCLQNVGVEILIHLLEPADQKEESDIIKKFRLPKLDFVLLSTAATFVSHGQLFITAVSEVLCYMNEISADLASVLWTRLHHHIKIHLETNLKKKKRETELFNLFLLALHNVINSETLPEKLTFAMINSFLDFPLGILSSTFFGGSLNGVHGVPALCLLRLLFKRRLIANLTSENSEVIIKCASSLVLCGLQNNVRILTFSQSVIDVFQDFVQLLKSTRFEKSPDLQANYTLLMSVWEKLGKELDAYILKSQEVNQGDSLDHDFSALYSFLLAPLSFGISGINCIETWTQVYKTFLWCSGFVTTCKPNEICDYLSSVILNEYNDELSESDVLLIASVCKCMISNAEYNHLSFNKPGRMSLHEAISCVQFGVSVPVLDRHKNLVKLCAVLSLLSKFLQKTTNSELGEVLAMCFSHLLTSINHPTDVRILFLYSLSALQTLICVKRKERQDKKLFNGQLENIFHAVVKQYSDTDDVKSLLGEDNFVQFVIKCMEQKDHKIRNVVVEFWQNLVVNSSQHALLCEELSGSFKSNIFPVYKQMSWDCPWKDTELPNSIHLQDTGTSQGESMTQSSMPPVAGYGAFGSPMKKHSFLSPKKSPLRPVSSPVKTPTKSPSSIKRKLNSLSEKLTFVKCTSPFPKPKTPLTKHQKEKMREKGFIPTMYNDLDEKQEREVEMQTQEDESPELATEDNKENSSENEKSNEDDIIESSQSQEIDTKRAKVDTPAKGKRRISLKVMAPVQEENSEENPDEGIPIRRSGRIKNQTDQQISDEKPAKNVGVPEQNVDSTVCDSDSDHDSLIGKHDEDEEDKMETTVETENDASYEYIETADASTNQTQNEISVLDETDDGKDLGVSPLDESYEYVELADMSVNVTAAVEKMDESKINEQASDDDDLMDDTGHESEYEAVAVADMSTNVVVQLERVDQVVKEKGITHHDLPSSANKMEDGTKPALRRSLRNSKKSVPEKTEEEEPDEKDYISSDGEENADDSSMVPKESDKTLNTTEYEYIEVADMSVAVEGNGMDDDKVQNQIDVPEIKVDAPEEVEQMGEDVDMKQIEDETDISKNDESVEDHPSLISEDADDEIEEDEFIDARSSLGSHSTRSDGNRSRSEVINISGESSASSDLFETSAEENDKTVDDQSILSVRDSSWESDGEKETEADHKDVEMNAVPTAIENDKIADANAHDAPVISELNEKDDAFSEPDRLTLANANESSPTQSRVEFITLPALAALKNQAVLPPGESPSAKGILKRRITIGAEMFPGQSPGNRRRVSFAEPISKKRVVSVNNDTYPQSPRSSLTHRKRQSPKVSRRLSLQPDKKPNEVPASPLSLRSVHVAEAIASIRAKDSNSPSCLSKSDDKKQTHSNENKLDLGSISVKDLENPELIKSLSKSQLKDLFSYLITTMPLLHAALMRVVDT